ncbi:MAG: hypothetical protein LIP08_12365, partial [Bacteroides sp.]|nr:hypothetical protein [Bacteroides sp.]
YYLCNCTNLTVERMKKRYNLPQEEDAEKNMVNEPAMEYEYNIETERIYSPPLTEEELKDAITGDELLEYIFDKIDKLPGK